MATNPITTHVCPDCAAHIDRLTGVVSQLEEDNNNLRGLDDTLRWNRGLFEALLANSFDGITLTAPDRRILRVIRGLTGFAPSELVGVLVESLVIPEDQHIIVNCYRDLLDSRCQRTKWEARFIRIDGSIAN